MSEASEIIVLCEDRLQEVFVRRFLRHGWGIKEPPVRVIPLPHGAGAGESHVRTSYPNQLRAYRARSAKAKTILIAVIDADTGSVQDHRSELGEACRKAQPPVDARRMNEAVVHVIPKRHIETWLAYLDDISVGEDQSYKTSHSFNRRESACHPLVDKLAEACRNRTALANPPESLRQACAEFDRIRALLI